MHTNKMYLFSEIKVHHLFSFNHSFGSMSKKKGPVNVTCQPIIAYLNNPMYLSLWVIAK